MTGNGFSQLAEELKQLKTVARPATIRAIAEAREHGDLSENAEYHAAKERQGFIEGRVKNLEAQISRAQVVDFSQFSGDQIKFGATVELADEETDEESTFHLVGAEESDVDSGLLSITSPLACALIGKSTGDSVDVVTPRGGKSYEIISVAYK